MTSTIRNTQNARKLRTNQTEAEKRLWLHLRNDNLGVRFRRQLSLGPYIADFACPSKKLIIEIDGGQHDIQQAYDQKRTSFFEQKGYTVIRFWNNDILDNTSGVVASTQKTLGSSHV